MTPGRPAIFRKCYSTNRNLHSPDASWRLWLQQAACFLQQHEVRVNNNDLTLVPRNGDDCRYYYVEIMGKTEETHVTHAVLVPEKWKRDTVLRLSGWAGGHLALL